MSASSVAGAVAEHVSQSHMPATAEQGAEIIGQLQRMIDLLDASSGRNPYTPIVVDLSKGQSQTIDLPAEAHQIEAMQVSGDTAATVKVFLQHSGILQAAGQLIGQVYSPASSVAPPLILNCPVPPLRAALTITTSVAMTNGALVITLARVRPGGYPYAG